jgi:hypothetical protein
MDLVDARTAGLKLSPKLYHANELRPIHQQLMTEAPGTVLEMRRGVCHLQKSSEVEETSLRALHRAQKTTGSEDL